MPLAVIELRFDPFLRVGGWSVPWQTVSIAACVLLVLLAAALIAGRTAAYPHSDDAIDEEASEEEGPDARSPEPAAGWMRWAAASPTDGGSWQADDADDARRTAGAEWVDDPPRGRSARLRRDDLLLIALGVVPGAVAGGRVVYALIHADYYRAVPGALVDPASGSLSLGGAVVGGILTGAIVARLLGPSVGRWMAVAAVPALLGLALGKVSLLLGGEGQGVASSAAYAIRFDARFAWPDPTAARAAAVPAQLLEAGATGLVLLVVLALWGTRIGRSGGVLFGVAVMLWALARFVVAFSWRDPIVAGPLRAEQVVSLAIAGLAVAGTLGAAVRRRRRQQEVEQELA